MSSRDKILGKLRQAKKPFTEIEMPETLASVAKVENASPDVLKSRFVEEAEKLGCYIYPAENEQEAINQILSLIGEEKQVLAWDDEHLPIAQLSSILEKNNIAVTTHDDSSALIGITGVDVALAASGSLVLRSGNGKFRTVSLLPDKHIAIVRTEQILSDMETWVQLEREHALAAFKESSNTTIVSGPSKTADIGQVLIKGAHGPREVHIIVLDN